MKERAFSLWGMQNTFTIMRRYDILLCRTQMRCARVMAEKSQIEGNAMYIETERLILRNALPTDTESYHTLWNTPSVLKFNVMNPPDLQQAAAAVDADAQSDKVLYIAQKENGQMIGQIFLEPDSLRYGVKSFIVSYSLMEEYGRKGYMTEALTAAIEYAFHAFQLDMVVSRVFADNIPSQRLLEKLGFTKEGTLRYAVQGYDGIVHDDMLFSLLREEFLS